VVAFSSIGTPAGSFMGWEVHTDYAMVDTSGGDLDRTGTVTSWYVENLGPVFTQDTASDGSVPELRELQAYVGFNP
jgi:hypothetical protein